ncbi:MAG: phytase, partial [Vibrio sp.]
MRLTLVSSMLMAVFLTGCDSEDTKTVYVESEASSEVQVEVEQLTTTSTTNTSYADIADSAYWINATNSDKSLLFVALEGDGLAVYNPVGEEQDRLQGIEVTGADIRYDITAQDGSAVDVLALALPDENSFGFYAIKEGLPLEQIGTLATNYAAEGVCLHKNTTNGDLLLTGVTEDGVAIQYKLKYDDGEIKSVLTDDNGFPIAVRELAVGGELSACIVDDETATLYVAEQEVGVWAYGVDPEDINSRRMLDGIEPLGHLQEIEALDLIYMPDGNGYLVIGDEVKGMMLYRRDDWQMSSNLLLEGIDEVKSLSIADDGIWVANSESDEPRYHKLPYSNLNSLTSIASLPITEVLSPKDLSSTGIGLVKVIGETTPVEDDGDAADDPAFWFNQETPEQSLIIATNKQGGLIVYDMAGNELQYINEGEPNNVDIIQSVTAVDGNSFALAAASNREFNTISLYKVQQASENSSPLSELAAIGANVHDEVAQLKSELNEVYGLCTYLASDGTPYVFINGKSGDIEQWRLTVQGSGIEGQIVRRLNVPSQPEGCVV